MTKTAWIRVDSGLAKTVALEDIRGITVSVQISPYDVPQAFRGFYDSNRGIFRIEFKYLDDEEAVRKPGDKCVAFEIGQHSQKLLAIELAVDEQNLSVVELELKQRQELIDRADKALAALRSRARRTNTRLNYKAADEVLRKNRDNPELFSASY